MKKCEKVVIKLVFYRLTVGLIGNFASFNFSLNQVEAEASKKSFDDDSDFWVFYEGKTKHYFQKKQIEYIKISPRGE